MSEQEPKVPATITAEMLESWATDPSSDVALHVKQRLLSIDASDDGDGILFPPTYADIGYNIDLLSDGTRVATIDSIGSQANRMEPLFAYGGPLADLVPQIKIRINAGTTVSIFDLPHRAGDATVLSSPKLSGLATEAFRALKLGNAAKLCALAPTSLVFGVWDSRGGSGEKRPRLIRSLIRAWNVEILHAAAQFNSVWKKLDESQQEALEKEATQRGVKLSVKGFADAPATFRKTKVEKYKDGSPNPDARVLGGVIAKGRIEREITINLLALRGLRGEDKEDKDETNHLRRYLLGLALLSAMQEMDLFLREGCLLRYTSTKDDWNVFPRRGDPKPLSFGDDANKLIREYICGSAAHFKKHWPSETVYEFNIAEAKKLLSNATDDEEAEGTN